MKRGWNENVGFYVNIAVFKATNLIQSEMGFFCKLRIKNLVKLVIFQVR